MTLLPSSVLRDVFTFCLSYWLTVHRILHNIFRYIVNSRECPIYWHTQKWFPYLESGYLIILHLYRQKPRTVKTFSASFRPLLTLASAWPIPCKSNSWTWRYIPALRPHFVSRLCLLHFQLTCQLGGRIFSDAFSLQYYLHLVWPGMKVGRLEIFNFELKEISSTCIHRIIFRLVSCVPWPHNLVPREELFYYICYKGITVFFSGTVFILLARRIASLSCSVNLALKRDTSITLLAVVLSTQYRSRFGFIFPNRTISGVNSTESEWHVKRQDNKWDEMSTRGVTSDQVSLSWVCQNIDMTKGKIKSMHVFRFLLLIWTRV